MTPKPRVWPVWLAFAVAMVAILVASGAVVQALDGAEPTPASMSELAMRPAVLAVSIAVTSALLALVALGAGAMSAEPLRARLRFGMAGAGAGDAALGVLAAISLGQAFDSLSFLLGLRGGSVLDVMARALAAMSPSELALVAVVGSVAPGLGEELFFRGYMQTRLVARWGRGAGIAVTSLAFGATHLDPLHAPAAFFMGLLLGWLTEATGAIGLGIVVHALNNLLSFVQQGMVDPGRFEPHGAWLAGSVVVFALAVIALGRRLARPPA